MVLLLKNLLFTVLVPGTVAGYLPFLIAQDRSAGSRAALAIAAAFFAVGTFIYGWCVWDFARLGRGTPAPTDAPKKLVVGGLYRYTRNPMYIGVLMVILGWSILFQAAELAVYALAVGTCFHLFTVLYEERRLQTQFGSQYDTYCSRVGRWLPRFKPRPAV